MLLNANLEKSEPEATVPPPVRDDSGRRVLEKGMASSRSPLFLCVVRSPVNCLVYRGFGLLKAFFSSDPAMRVRRTPAQRLAAEAGTRTAEWRIHFFLTVSWGTVSLSQQRPDVGLQLLDCQLLSDSHGAS